MSSQRLGGVLAGALILLISVTPCVASQQAIPVRTTCPPPRASNTRQVKRALSQARLAWFKRKYGLTKVSAGDLRVLKTKSDRGMCALLDKYYDGSMFAAGSWKRSYYYAHGFYFASFINTASPTSREPRLGHFAVFDSDLKLVSILRPK